MSVERTDTFVSLQYAVFKSVKLHGRLDPKRQAVEMPALGLEKEKGPLLPEKVNAEFGKVWELQEKYRDAIKRGDSSAKSIAEAMVEPRIILCVEVWLAHDAGLISPLMVHTYRNQFESLGIQLEEPNNYVIARPKK